MYSLKKSKKGFTLTELAIVIAVIAILIAVLVPTFVSLINKANNSSDEQTVKNMNTALSTDTSGDLTFCEARAIIEENGIDSHYTAIYTVNKVYWCQSAQCVVVVKDGAISFPEGVNATYQEDSDDFIMINSEGDHDDLMATNGSCKLCGETSSVAEMVENSIITVDASDSTVLTSVSATVTDLVIPDTITSISITKSATKITGEGASKENTTLKTVVIPDSVTGSTGSSAFKNCVALESVTIGSGIEAIDSSAFSGCTALTDITIGSNVTNINTSAFSGCSSLTSITLPDSLTSIGTTTFSNCSSLTDIAIGKNVTSIGSNAFSSTAYYNDVNNWVDGVLYLDNYLLKAKTTLSGSYTVKDGTTLIAAAAFGGGSETLACTSLTSITLPNTLKYINQRAFSYCTSLNSITFGGNELEIGEYAFSTCTALTSVTLPSSLTTIEKYAFNASGITNVTFSSTSGWYVTTTKGETSGTTVTDFTDAATLLKTTYVSYYWYKTTV